MVSQGVNGLRFVEIRFLAKVHFAFASGVLRTRSIDLG
jgi:hypothetical protein